MHRWSLLLVLLVGCWSPAPPRPLPEPPPSFSLLLEAASVEVPNGARHEVPVQVLWESGQAREVSLSVTFTETRRPMEFLAQPIALPALAEVIAKAVLLEKATVRIEPATVPAGGGMANLIITVPPDARGTEYRIVVTARAENMEDRTAALFLSVQLGRTLPPPKGAR
jgi:hypothetical protein